MALTDVLNNPVLRFIVPRRFRDRPPLVPVVRLTGAIGVGGPLMPGLSLAGSAAALDRAFAFDAAPAVAIVVNSPGGSAVQSHLIHKRIRTLASEKKKTVFAFVEDVAASGGYMIACAADEIFCDGSSIVGSIGVISSGFGFDRAIEKLGVERRVVASGAFKGMLDPFQPLREEEIERLRALQRDVHRQFVGLVETRRNGRLSTDGTDLFTGEFWVGTKALELGLVDGIGDLRTVMRERFGEKVRLRLVGERSGGWLRRVVGRRAEEAWDGLPAAALATVEARALWARYGL